MRSFTVCLLILPALGLYSITQQTQELMAIVDFLQDREDTAIVKPINKPISKPPRFFLQDNEPRENARRPPRFSLQDNEPREISMRRAGRAWRRPPRLDSRGLKRTRATEKVIYYLHIHKSGGTQMCVLMNYAGISANFKKNCNVQRDQRCCGGDDTIEAQRSFANITKFDFVASEQEMYEAMDTESYFYTVTLRNSRDRYFSHYGHVMRTLPRTAGMRTIGKGSKRDDTFRDWYSKQPDNWNTRMICGFRCSQIPKFQLSREDFSYTLGRLRRFSAILFLEKFDASLNKFADQFNLTLPATIKKKNAAKQNTGQHSKSDWDPLMSSLDDALYEIAEGFDRGGTLPNELSPEREGLLENYFQNGKDRGCINPCCAPECSTYR